MVFPSESPLSDCPEGNEPGIALPVWGGREKPRSLPSTAIMQSQSWCVIPAWKKDATSTYRTGDGFAREVRVNRALKSGMGDLACELLCSTASKSKSWC